MFQSCEPSGTSERELVFNEAFEENHKALHAYVLGRTGDDEAAKDLLQETFLRAWRSIGQLQALAPDRRRYWLFAVARNLVTDHYRTQARRSAAHENAGRALTMSSTAGLEQARLDSLALDEAMRALPEHLRTPLALQALAGMSSREIGLLTGKPAGTVRYEISLARRILADQLGLGEGNTGTGR